MLQRYYSFLREGVEVLILLHFNLLFNTQNALLKFVLNVPYTKVR